MGNPKEKFLLENQFIKSLQEKHQWECGELLEKLDSQSITNQGLALCIYLYKDNFHFKPSLLYLINSFKNHPLYKIMTKRLNFLLGKASCTSWEEIGSQSPEKIYFINSNGWLKGECINHNIPMSFYKTYSVFHVPDLFWLGLTFQEVESSYFELLSLVCQNYLKGCIKEAEKHFYRLLKKYKERLLTRNLDYYFFLLGHYYYQKEKFQKCVWYLEQCFLIVREKHEPIFLLKIFSLNLRVFYQDKD